MIHKIKLESGWVNISLRCDKCGKVQFPHLGVFHEIYSKEKIEEFTQRVPENWRKIKEKLYCENCQ